MSHETTCGELLVEKSNAKGRWRLDSASALALGVLMIVPLTAAASVFSSTLASASAGGSTYVLTPTPHRTLMKPFPIVRIAGRVTARGARIRLLAVQAPPGARATVRCRGRHCPVTKQSRLLGVTAASVRTGLSAVTFRFFERRLRARTVLQIVVTRGDEIGKYTSFYIRAGRLPVRNDACVDPSNPRPIACPTP